MRASRSRARHEKGGHLREDANVISVWDVKKLMQGT